MNKCQILDANHGRDGVNSVRWWFFIALLTCFPIFLFYLTLPLSPLPSYKDEIIYVRCGLDYVANLTAPYTCNFEHPPLGKYLIGFFELFGFGRFAYMFLFVGSSVFVFLIARSLVSSGSTALLTTSFIILDTVFINTYRHLLLDPPAVFLLLLSLYLMLLRGSLILSGLFFGLSVACKLSVLPYLLVFAYAIMAGGGGWRASLRRLALFTAVALTAYLSTYAADFSLGPYSVVQHHLEMISYMSWRHGLTLPMAVNGLFKLISKVEVWRYGGEFSLYFTTTNTSFLTLVANSTITPASGLYVVVGVGLGSILWYATLPSLLINAYWAMVRRLNSAENLVTLAGWLSLATILPGPHDWYYINALPALYLNVALTLSRLVRGRRGSTVLISLTLAQVLITLTTLAGVLPFDIVYILSNPT